MDNDEMARLDNIRRSALQEFAESEATARLTILSLRLRECYQLFGSKDERTDAAYGALVTERLRQEKPNHGVWLILLHTTASLAAHGVFVDAEKSHEALNKFYDLKIKPTNGLHLMAPALFDAIPDELKYKLLPIDDIQRASVSAKHISDMCKQVEHSDAQRAANKRVAIRDGLVIVDAYDDNVYDIPLERIKTVEHLLGWALHVGRKKWADKQLMIDLIAIVCIEKHWNCSSF